MTDDLRGALAANQAFYDAFAAGDIKAMEAVWAVAAPVACAHPGAPLLVGRETVLQSWASILGGSGKPDVSCSDAQAHLLGDAAYVTCYERIGGAGGSILLATNILAREAGGWRMVHHHASPTPVAPPRRAEGGGSHAVH